MAGSGLLFIKDINIFIDGYNHPGLPAVGYPYFSIRMGKLVHNTIFYRSNNPIIPQSDSSHISYVKNDHIYIYIFYDNSVYLVVVMNIFYLLIGVSLVAALVFLVLFIWAVKSGQYEDNYTPSVRVLFDDDEPESEED